MQARLPADGAVGVTLSGGLDSGAVAATAARRLDGQGRRLQAFTAVPVADTTPYVGPRFGDELPLARAVVTAAGNIDLRTLDSRHLTPVQGIRRALEIVGTPIHAASNQFWLIDLQRAAAEHGCQVLLTGQMGNAGVSWTGSLLSQPWGDQLRRLGVQALVRQHLRRSAPRSVQLARARRGPEDFPNSAIAPAFARRLGLAQRRFEDPELFPRTPVADRLRTLRPGRLVVGDVYSRISAASGVDVRDPTADVRVIRYVLLGPRPGVHRSRNRRRSVADPRGHAGPAPGPGTPQLPPRSSGRRPGSRLRASGAEVEGALDELAAGPATAYLDLGHMRACGRWSSARTRRSP